MAQLDPNIILSGEDPMQQQQRALQLNAMQMRAQEDQRQQRSQMQLRDVFSQPGALDEKTGEPTGQALNKIMRIDPRMGMDIQKSVLAAQKDRVDIASKISKQQQDKLEAIRDVAVGPAVAAYDRAKESGAPEQVASDAGQKAYTEGLTELEKFGKWSDQEKAAFPRKFDPTFHRGRAIEIEKTLADISDKKRQRELEETRVGYEGKRVGLEAKSVGLQGAQVSLAQRRLADEESGKIGGSPEQALMRQYSQENPKATAQDKADFLTKLKSGEKPKWEILTDPEHTDAEGKTVPAQQYRYNPMTTEATTLGGQPYSPTGAAKMGGASSGVISDQAADFIAERVLSGDPDATKNMSRSQANMTKVENLVATKAKDRRIGAGQLSAAIAVVKADRTSLASITKMTDAAVSFEQTASLNFDQALKLAPAAIPTNWGPWLNKWVENGETFFGNTDVPPYVTAMLTGANEYAKIMSGSTGAQGSTVDSRREAATLFSPYLSQGQIKAVVAVAKRDMDNRKKSLDAQVETIRSRIQAEDGGAPKQAEAAAPSPGEAAAKPSAGKFEEGKVYRDGKGNKARYQGGKWVPVE